MAEDLVRPAMRSRRAAHTDHVSFTRQLHYEIASAEGRALVASYALAVALGALWLLLVHILPVAPPVITLLRPEETEPVQVTFDATGAAEPAPAPSAVAPRHREPAPAPDKRDESTDAIGAAFGGSAPSAGGGTVGDVSHVLRDVDVAPMSGGATNAAQGKAVIAYGHGGQGSRTPGRGGLGTGLDAQSADDVGSVGGGSGIGHASVRVEPPHSAHTAETSAPTRDVAELGGYVRGHQAQLQFCYEEYGLKANANLAGTIAVAVTLGASGAVTSVSITRRTWSGAGTAETESCIQSRVSAWTFPASHDGGGTYDFSFVFNR